MALILVPDELNPDDCAFLASVANGLVTARAKYPGNSRRKAGLYGEMGEAMVAIQRIEQERGTVQELAAELRQVAQMACRLAVEGDATFSPEVQAQFPCIVQPDPTLKPHQPGFRP